VLSFSSQGILSPLPGELRRQYGDCDYDVRHNISAFGIYQVPFSSSTRCCGQFSAAGRFPKTAFFHSGLPFTVLVSLIRQMATVSFRVADHSCAQRSRCAALREVSLLRRDSGGHKAVVEPGGLCLCGRSDTGACTGGDSASNCQFGNAGRNTVRGPHFTYSDIYLTKKFPIKGEVSLRFDTQFFNAFNHPNFALPSNVEAGVPGVYVRKN